MNDCTLVEFLYAILSKREQESTISRFKKVHVSMSFFEDHRLEWTDLTIVHNSKSIRAGPGVALLWKFKDSEPTDKISQGLPLENGEISVCVSNWIAYIWAYGNFITA